MSRNNRSTTHLNPDDFEAGEDVTGEFEVRRPIGIVLSVRLTGEEAAQLEQIGRREGKTLIETAREALLATIAAGTLPVAPRT